MITFFWLWLLLAASPLLAKSITTTVTQYQEGEGNVCNFMTLLAF